MNRVSPYSIRYVHVHVAYRSKVLDQALISLGVYGEPRKWRPGGVKLLEVNPGFARMSNKIDGCRNRKIRPKQ